MVQLEHWRSRVTNKQAVALKKKAARSFGCRLLEGGQFRQIWWLPEVTFSRVHVHSTVYTPRQSGNANSNP